MRVGEVERKANYKLNERWVVSDCSLDRMIQLSPLWLAECRCKELGLPRPYISAWQRPIALYACVRDSFSRELRTGCGLFKRCQLRAEFFEALLLGSFPWPEIAPVHRHLLWLRAAHRGLYDGIRKRQTNRQTQFVGGGARTEDGGAHLNPAGHF